MKVHLVSLLGLVGLSISLAAAPPKADPELKWDFQQPQSPPRRVPPWFKAVDQGAHDPRLKGYLAPEGVKVEIVAEFPVVRNPVGMTFGDDGSLYVIEWTPDAAPARQVAEEITYKDGSRRTVAVLKKNVKDVVKVLRDTQGKGVYDKAEVVLEDELPSSILLHDGWLYLSGRGTVRRYKQSKPGGPYDVKQVITQGFGGLHHHQVSGLTLGNDGWLYVTVGDGDHHVEGSDGSRATVLRTGAIFRCRPDGSRMHVFSSGYLNPYRDVAFDTAFNLFHADNDLAKGGKFTGCRLMHVAEDSDFGWRRKDNGPDPVRAAVYGELPGKLPPLLKTGRGAPAGLLIYTDSRFPEHYQGLLHHPDVGRQLIRAYKVEPEGSTFEVTEEFEFLKSNDPLFRPCQMVVGPDGAIYICDWRTDSSGDGRLSGDGQHGRIYRAQWSGTEGDPAIPLRGLNSWARIAKLAEDDLIEALAAEDFSDRLRAQRELVRRGANMRPALLKLLEDGDEPVAARIAALGALNSLWNADVQKLFMRLLRDSADDIRRLAAQGLGLNCAAGDSDAQNALLQNLGDPEPAVRRAIALAMGRIAAEGAAEALVATFKADDGKDLVLHDGLLRAIERTGKDGIQKLMDVVDSGVETDRDKVYEAFLWLRIRPAADVLPTILKSPHPNIAQRASLIRSYNNYLLEPPVSLEPLLDYLLSHADEATQVKQAGLDVLAAAPAADKVPDKGQRFLQALLGETDVNLVRGTVALLGRTAEGARLAGERFLAGKLPRELRAEVAAALRKHAGTNPELAKLLTEVMKGG